MLGGELSLDVQGALTPGTALTIMSGSSISGSFDALPRTRVLHADGHLFSVSYTNNKRDADRTAKAAAADIG